MVFLPTLYYWLLFKNCYLVEALKVLTRKKIVLWYFWIFGILSVSANAYKKSSLMFLGEMSIWEPHWAWGSQTEVRNGSNIKGIFWGVGFCIQGFFEEGNSRKLIIFGEIKNFPYLHAIFVILGRKKWVKIVIMQKSGNFTHKGFLRLSISWKW